MSETSKRKYCVIGTPVAHSKSPELFARFFAERGLTDSCEYVINEIRTQEELEAFILEMRDGRWEGCNVTMPWKNAVVPLVDRISVFSELTSAVNTIRRRPDGSLYGTSTDGAGLLWAIRKAVALSSDTKTAAKGFIGESRLGDMNVAILGAGGSARSVLAAFIVEGMNHCSVISREGANKAFTEKVLKKAGRAAGEGKEVSGDIGFVDFDDEDKVRDIVTQADIVINCTPLGMVPQEDKIPVPKGTVFKTGAIAADAVYNPENTLLLQRAARQGCITVPGRMMLEGQARVAADVLI